MKNLALDFDGTLIEISSRDYWLYYDVMHEMGHSTLKFHEYWPLRRERYPLDRLLKINGCNDVDRYISMRMERCELPEYLRLDVVLDGTLEALQLLARHFRCYVVTARGNVKNTLDEIKSMDLLHYLSDVIVASGPKLDALRELDPVAMVGDTENDVFPARELGIRSIAVCSGIRSREYLKTISPDHVVENITEVPRLLLVHDVSPTTKT